MATYDGVHHSSRQSACHHYDVFTLSETKNDFCSETDEMAKSSQSHWLLLDILSVSLQKSFSVSLSVNTPLAQCQNNNGPNFGVGMCEQSFNIFLGIRNFVEVVAAVFRPFPFVSLLDSLRMRLWNEIH